MARAYYRTETIDGSLGTPVYAATRDCAMRSAPDVGVGVTELLTLDQIRTIAKYAEEGAGLWLEQTWTESGGLHTYIHMKGTVRHVATNGNLSDPLGIARSDAQAYERLGQ